MKTNPIPRLVSRSRFALSFAIAVTLLSHAGNQRALATNDLGDSGPDAGQPVDLAAAIASNNPEWSKPSPEVESAVHKLLEDHGIEPDEVFGRGAGEERSAAEILAISAQRMALGSIEMRERWKDWNPADAGRDDAKALVARIENLGATATSAGELLETAVPSHWVYRGLLEEYRALREVADTREASRPLPIPEADGIVSAGDSYAGSKELARRLRRGGYLETAAEAGLEGDVFTRELSDGLKRFQADQGLKADGVIGPNTLRGLNRTVEERLRLLALNLERARLLPVGLGERHLIVNLPSGRLMGFSGEKLGIDMRVVFGGDEPGTRTRLFADQMSYLVFRPYWNIPAGIARDEIVPAARKDASYLRSRRYEIVPDFGHSGGAISPDAAALDAVEEGSLKMRQMPGPKNALGLVKFLFPNDHAIYLHDTPQDHLFSRSQRAFSHGCIRVEHPKQLAEWVLEPEGWSRTKVSEALSSGDNRHVQLDQSIPVYIVYFTAMPEWHGAGDRQNTIRFYHDIYERD